MLSKQLEMAVQSVSLQIGQPHPAYLSHQQRDYSRAILGLTPREISMVSRQSNAQHVRMARCFGSSSMSHIWYTKNWQETTQHCIPSPFHKLSAYWHFKPNNISLVADSTISAHKSFALWYNYNRGQFAVRYTSVCPMTNATILIDHGTIFCSSQFVKHLFITERLTKLKFSIACVNIGDTWKSINFHTNAKAKILVI